MTIVGIDWGGLRPTTGRLVGQGPVGILLAHGAGTNQDHPNITTLRDGLAAAGFTVLTFNYPYTEAGGRRPDPPGVLLDCHRGALRWLGGHTQGGVVLAGRSMGGRMATHLAAEGERCLGLVLYAYPLHPPASPADRRKPGALRLRADHLPAVGVPMLFFVGTRDGFCRLDLYDRLVRPLPNVTTEVIEGADHGWKVSGSTYALVAAAAVERTAAWIRRLPTLL